MPCGSNSLEVQPCASAPHRGRSPKELLMRNALVLAAVIAAAAFGQVYSLGSSPAPELKAGNPPVDLDTLIWYDQLDTSHWWVGMYDSFAIAVRFTPDRYPCQVMGARAEVNRGGYAATYYLRVYAPDGTGGRPGTILQSTPRTDLPLNARPASRTTTCRPRSPSPAETSSSVS